VTLNNATPIVPLTNSAKFDARRTPERRLNLSRVRTGIGVLQTAEIRWCSTISVASDAADVGDGDTQVSGGPETRGYSD